MFLSSLTFSNGRPFNLEQVVSVCKNSLLFMNSSGTVSHVSMFFIQWKKGGGALILAVLPRDDFFLFGLLVDQLTLSLSWPSHRLTIQSDLYIYCVNKNYFKLIWILVYYLLFIYTHTHTRVCMYTYVHTSLTLTLKKGVKVRLWLIIGQLQKADQKF